MKVKRIGYQGIEGSNSEASAKNMAGRLGLTNVEFIPLIHSRGVVEALKRGTVDYGVMATRNHLAGIVKETKDALDGLRYREAASDCIAIHHCLFVKSEAVTILKSVASHPQALKQCRGSLAKLYPEAQLFEIEDTAIGARYLADGTFDDTVGVLCRKNAGEAFGLYLLRENMEDDPTNATDFTMIELEAENE